MTMVADAVALVHVPGCECNDCRGTKDPMPFHQCGCGCPRLVPCGQNWAKICIEGKRRREMESQSVKYYVVKIKDDDPVHAKLDRIMAHLGME